MGPGRALRGPAVQSAVDGVQLRAELAPHVEPPIAHEHRLAELGAVRAEERCLAAVYVAIMPRLASRLHVREEARIRLVVAVEIRVRHLAQHRIIGAGSTCNETFRESFEIFPPINKMKIFEYSWICEKRFERILSFFQKLEINPFATIFP